MINLIKNEFIKVFKKKNIYICTIILALFVILTNVLYTMMDKIIVEDYSFEESYIDSAKEELKTLNINQDKEYYISKKTDIDIYDLYKKYDKDSWQAYIVKKNMYNYVYNANAYKYGLSVENEYEQDNPEVILNNQIEKLNKSDWKDYVKENIEENNRQIVELKNMLIFDVDSKEKAGIESEIKRLELVNSLNQKRIDNNIPYGNNYINNAIDEYIQYSSDMETDINQPNLTYSQKRNIQSYIETREKDKYIIETGKNVNNFNNAGFMLTNIFVEYGFFIIIFIVMISGVIVSSEFEKGTIKMLLVKPYKRWKILLSKYIVSITMVIVGIFVVALMQLIVGGLFFGFDTLSTPIVVYDFGVNQLQTYNVFAYFGIMLLTKLPMFILIATLSFTASTLFSNSVLGIIIPIVCNIGGNIVNSLASSFNIKQLMWFPTLNWDFSEYLFGKLPTYQYSNLGLSIALSSIYLVSLCVIAFIAFNKKQVKNI